MNPRRRHTSERGTVLLVALCFAAVVAISLSSYLALSNQAMRQSNRAFQNDLSRQLAEAGLEQALAAFNENDWSGWTTSGTTATRTVTFPSSKYGSSGVIGSFRLRVDNYNAFNLSSTWSSGTTYYFDDLVGRNGVWYRCLVGHTASASNQPPNLNYWAPEGLPWRWVPNTRYTADDMVNVNGTWYRCRTTHTGGANFAVGTNWERIDYIYLSPPAYPYVTSGEKAYALNGNQWVEFTYKVWGTNTPPISWRWRDSGYAYKANDYVFWNGDWYRCVADHTSGNWSYSLYNLPNAYWKKASDLWTWNSTSTYERGDVAFRNGTWYRALRSHTNKQPPNSAYWSDAPAGTNDWQSDRTYSSNSVVFHNGAWYRNTSSTSATPPNAPWVSAATPTWNPTTNYGANDYVAFGGVWYRCIAGHSGRSPNQSTHWTAVGAPVVYAEGVARLPDGPPIRTQLRATISRLPLFPNAVAATEAVNFSSSGSVDSYDSTLGTYASQTPGFSAIVAGGLTTGTAVNLAGNFTVSGYVAAPSNTTSPHAPRFNYSSSAVVKGTTATPNPRVDLRRVSRSPFIPTLNTHTPVGGISFSMPNNASITIGVPGATTPSVYQISGNLDLDSSLEVLNIVGPVILNITGRLYITGGRINIARHASAEIHFGGQLYVGGSSSIGIFNLSENPKNCILIGTSTGNSLGSHYYWSTAPFYGVIYMPNAHLSTWNNVVTYGAYSAKNVSFPQPGSVVHYDTTLRHAAIPGVDEVFMVNEWRQLDGSEQANF